MSKQNKNKLMMKKFFYMKSKNLIFIIFILFASVSFQSCLKDTISSALNFEIPDTIQLLSYLEEQGNYINSANMPSLVNVDEVQANLNSYLILDIRTSDKYTAGHIPGAVNVTNSSLLNYINTSQNKLYSKIVIVSENGQSSAYYTSLLRLYGFNNIYSLLFGMAQWNRAFANVWLNNMNNSQVSAFLNNNIYLNDTLTQLPQITFSNANADIQSKVRQRISEVINAGFKSGESYVEILNPSELLFNDEDISKFYIACYGKDSLYLADRIGSGGSGHFEKAILYRPQVSLLSTKTLQTLPSGKRIVVYSASGIVSAFVTAYLRLLGYDAKSLKFGISSIAYGQLYGRRTALSPEVFLSADIRNYTYTTGANP